MKKTLLIAAIALVITAGTVSLVNAQAGEKQRANKQELTAEKKIEWEARKAEIESQREEIQNIIENGTYEEWKTLVESRPRMTDYINEENFESFRKIHELKQAGDLEGVKEIMTKLGIEEKMGMKKGFNKGMHKGIKNNCDCQK